LTSFWPGWPTCRLTWHEVEGARRRQGIALDLGRFCEIFSFALSPAPALFWYSICVDWTDDVWDVCVNFHIHNYLEKN
jgi:hypothetical protein